MFKKAVMAMSAVCFILGLAACSAAFDATDVGTASDNVRAVAASAATGQRRVVGYFCEWGIYAAHDSYYVTSIPFDKLTHINYAFVGINPDTLAVEVYDPWASLEIVYPGEPWDTEYKGNLGMFRKMKLQYPNVKVLISIGGWTKSHGFHNAAKTETSRRITAENLVAFMKQYELDGIDIDWEYPGIDRAPDWNDPYDKGAPGGPEDTVNYTLFMQAIRDELDEQGILDNRYYELTAAVGIGYDKIAVTDPAAYSQYLDAINLMTYDMHGGFESVIGHQAPLYPNLTYDTHEPLVTERYNVDWAVNKFLDLGVPANKLVVGLPFYSRGWNNVSGGWDVDNDGRPDGMFGTGGGTLAGVWGIGGQSPYFTMKALENQQGWEKYRDPYSNACWLYNRTTNELYTYDDAATVNAKLDYILDNNLGGAMYWELDGDDWHNGYDLVNIIAAKMLDNGYNPPVDTEAPTVPTGLTVSGITSNSAVLSWNASSDNVGVAGYTVTVNNTPQTVRNTSVTLTGLSPATAYTVTIVAFDAAANNSGGVPISFTTAAGGVPDNTAPTTPSGLAVTGITANSASVSWNASTDNVGVAGYVVTYNGQTVTVSGTSIVISGLSPATTYTVTVAAFDAAENDSAAAQANFTTTSNLYQEWVLHGTYNTGDRVTWQGHIYVCISTHTAYSPDWNPAQVPSLWSLVE